MKEIGFVTLGCAKNLVDTELMIGILHKEGFKVNLDTANTEIVVVNTCAFIGDAQKESIKTILNLLHQNKKVVVTGCLSQRFLKELKAEIPEISGYLGTSDYDKIGTLIKNVVQNKYFECVNKPDYKYNENIERMQITTGASSYIKIADGCNFNCGYCIIPSIKGKYKSRKIEDIVKEAKTLANKGVREIILIAQDTTNYGIDIYKKPSLDKLLYELNKVENIDWIRVLYAYPTNFNDDLIKAYQKLDKVVKYVDIPLQHSDKEVLKKMNRPIIDYKKLISKIRKIKDVCIRTTLIVGYPTETDEQFNNLYNFVSEMKFDRLGVFTYSREKGTISYDLKPQVKEKVKKIRKKKIMELQKQISKENNKKMLNKKIKCIVDSICDNGTIIARSYKDSPDIDGCVFVTNKTDMDILPTDIIDVEIVGFDEYDLIGVI